MYIHTHINIYCVYTYIYAYICIYSYTHIRPRVCVCVLVSSLLDGCSVFEKKKYVHAHIIRTSSCWRPSIQLGAFPKITMHITRNIWGGILQPSKLKINYSWTISTSISDLDAANLQPALEQGCWTQTPSARKLFVRANLPYVSNFKM